MNFAVSRPHVLPRALSQSQEDLQTVKTPTPEPVEVETRKVIQMHCSLERKEDKARLHVCNTRVHATRIPCMSTDAPV
ncbi:hypothetical protein AB205_0021970 [Aquarana catesbeiana]|uniref:Uncharacterized protein n=1 Tax=Aquarana catesbeiana TaxID=8400 RepID=A0A2G9RFW9_AQUCT|nr:hypothetical protein AB205_0021970 [Aquarana catesbeiana]